MAGVKLHGPGDDFRRVGSPAAPPVYIKSLEVMAWPVVIRQTPQQRDWPLAVRAEVG